MFEDDEEPDYKTPLEKWEEEHNTGQSAGTCPKCGSRIFQSTHADSCMCGEQDFAY
jgi:ribosomal protein S27AE